MALNGCKQTATKPLPPAIKVRMRKAMVAGGGGDLVKAPWKPLSARGVKGWL